MHDGPQEHRPFALDFSARIDSRLDLPVPVLSYNAVAVTAHKSRRIPRLSLRSTSATRKAAPGAQLRYPWDVPRSSSRPATPDTGAATIPFPHIVRSALRHRTLPSRQ